MTAKDPPLVSSGQTASLPATVVAELELNSVMPPPDTIEEERMDESIVNATDSKPNPHYST